MYQHMQKKVYILSRPSKLQPMANYSIALPFQLITQQDLPQLLSTLKAQEMYQYTHKELYILPEPYRFAREPILVKQTLVQHRQNTSWEPATVMSQCTTNSYWIMQENGTEQPKVYRRIRSMLKIRCTLTEVKQTGYRNSQSTETEKAAFHTPAIPNMARNHVKDNSAEKISCDLVQQTSDTQASASFNFESEEREEIADVSTTAPPLETVEEQSTTLQDPESQQERTLEGQPVHLVILHVNICKDTSASALVDYQFKKMNFELNVLYSRAK